MSEKEKYPEQKTVWRNVGVAHMSNSGKSVLLNLGERDLVVNLENLQKVIDGKQAVCNVSVAEKVQ
jgi:hypothetical protein